MDRRENQSENIEPWRLTVLNVGSTTMAVAGALTAFWIFASGAQSDEWIPAIWTTPLALPVAVCALWRRGPYFWRSMLFLIPPIAGVFGLSVLAGFTSTPALAGVASVVIAGLLLGPRWAVGTWILTTLLVLSAGLLVWAGVLESGFSVEAVDPSLLTNGIRNTLSYALFSSALALGTSVVVDQLSRSLAETRRALDAQREVDAQWLSLVENAVDQIALVDREHRIEFLNHSIADIDRSETIGRPVEEILPGQEGAEIAASIDRVFETGAPSLYSFAAVTAEGQRLHLEARISPVLRDEKIHRVTIIIANATERYRLEEQLRQSQKLEAVGELASGVAHDFNNLLTVISGFSEDLLGRVEVDGEIGQGLSKIQEAAHRGARLTSQLLTFSREHPTELRTVDLNTAVEEMRDILQRLIGTPYPLDFDLHQKTRSIRADPVQIDQVLTNLVLNARDSMPEAGPIRVETRRVRIPEDRTKPLDLAPGEYVSLAVIDRGAGIPPELEERIFEPFFTTKEVGKGTGLGLATSYGIIRSFHGAIRVDSTAGEGTRFEVLLPCVPGQQAIDDQPADLAPDQASAARQAGRTILLVEDEPQIRALVRSVLKRADFEILEAEDGEAALAVADAYSGPIDLVLSDVRMPNMSGPELARRLRANRPQIGIVFMTGFAADVDTTGLDAKVLSKPFSIRSLPAELESMIGARSPSVDQ